MRLSCFPFALVALSMFVVGCSKAGESASSDSAAPAQASQASPEGVLMERGLISLYRSGDPFAAEAAFREVLARNPAHYGAQYQLAVALDRGGKPDSARAVWTDVLRVADSVKDVKTARIARSRLASPDTVSTVNLMIIGLNFLKRGNPDSAAAEFRKVLELKPNHYGANYQLAAVLDRTGHQAEARPYWQKVLRLAESIKDEPTAATARRHLSQKP